MIVKPTLRSLVLAFFESLDNGRGCAQEIHNMRAAVTRVKKEKPAKVAKPKKESKHFDAMIADPRGTFERVMHYFVTKEGRAGLGDLSPAIISASVITLARTQS